MKLKALTKNKGCGLVSSNMKQRLAYSFGAFGHMVNYATLSVYFMVFVTSSMFEGVEPKTAAKLIGIITSLIVGVRLVEIFFDPIIGGIIDNTRTKYGKFKPWIVIGGCMSGLLLMLVFTNFFGLTKSNPTLFLIVFSIVFILLDCFYSFKDISFWSMPPALSSDSEEREKIYTFANVGVSIGGAGINVVLVPIVTFFTLLATGKNEQGASGWFAFAVIAGGITIITSIVTAMFTTEKDSIIRKESGKHSFKAIFKSIFTNDQLMWMLAAYILSSMAGTTTNAVLFYLFKYVLDAPQEFWIVGIISMIMGFAITPLFPILSKKITRRYVYIIGTLMMITSYAILALAGNNLIISIIGLVMYFMPQSLISLTVIMTITDSVEYAQLKNGERNEAVTLSVRPLIDKLAGALSNGIVGFIAVTAGMTGSATARTVTANGVHLFKMYAFYIPAGLLVLALIVFVSKIKLTEKKHAEIVKALEIKLSAEAE